jgi:hypothetical protein
VNRPKRRVFASTLERRRPHPGRDASRGEWRAIPFVSPFHGAPKRSSPSAKDLSSPHGADWPPSSLLHCRSLLDGTPRWAPLLSVFTINTRARTTQSPTRPASDTPCQVVSKTGAVGSLRPRRSLMASHSEKPDPSGLGRSTEVDHPSPVAALAEARPFPVDGARPRETMRVIRVMPRLSARHPGPRHVAKTTDTRCRFRVGAHLRRHVRPSNRSRGGHGRHDPSPMKLRQLLVATAPVIPRKPTMQANLHGF